MNIKLTSWRLVLSSLSLLSLFSQENLLAQEPFVSTNNNINSPAEETFRQIPAVLFESVVIFRVETT